MARLRRTARKSVPGRPYRVEGFRLPEQVQIKIALDHVQLDHKRDILSSSVLSSKRERKDLIFRKQANVMIHEKHAGMKGDTHATANCFSDAIAGDPISRAALEMEAERLEQDEGETILHVESMRGNAERVEYIVREFADKNLLVKLDISKQTALHLAADNGHTQVVEVLIDAAQHLPSSANSVSSFKDFIRQANDQIGNTALHLAVLNCNMAIVKLLVDADPNDSHVQNNEGKTPIYIAAEKGYKDIVKVISTTCTALSLTGPGGRTTVLHALIQNINQEASEVIRMTIHAAKCWSSADFESLFCRTDELGNTVLQFAVEKNCMDVVRLILLEDPAYQHGGETKRNDLMRLIFKAIDNGCSDDIVKLLSQTYEAGIINPDHKDLLSLILAIKRRDEANSPYTATDENGRNILHLAAADNRKEMVKGILKYCPEKYKDLILKQQDTSGDGDTPLHLLISHGCYIPELINHKGLDTMAKNKKKFTPRDMLYFKNEIIADQVQIKIALDDVQANQSAAWKLWGKSTEKKTDTRRSIVPPSKRRIKDVIFDEHKKLVMDAKHEQMKKDLERYKMRTNTQIIVTALITTVTFTVGFTMPGGLRQSGEVDEGQVVLTKKTVFNAFMVSDALALLLSTCSLFLYFLESMYEDPHQVSKLNAASVGLNIVSVVAMMLTFITGTYLVLSHSPALAITVCLIGSFFIFVIVLLIKFVYDRRVKRNED
ncbi:hypothetical protein AgCh_040148 [Apium graveolens]